MRCGLVAGFVLQCQSALAADKARSSGPLDNQPITVWWCFFPHRDYAVKGALDRPDANFHGRLEFHRWPFRSIACSPACNVAATADQSTSSTPLVKRREIINVPQSSFISFIAAVSSKLKVYDHPLAFHLFPQLIVRCYVLGMQECLRHSTAR